MSMKLEHVSYTYMPGTPYEKEALKDVSLEINKGEFVAVGEVYLAALEGPYAVFGTLRVQHYRYRKIEFFAHRLDHIYLFLMILVRSVRKVQARNVHTRKAHLFENFWRIARRPYRANYLRHSHDRFLFFIAFYIMLLY